MKYKDYYAALGVARDADVDAIKKAYRKLARQHHPDMSKAPDAEARFKEAGEAYATLKDADKRAAYDELGRRPAGEDFAPPPQWRQAHSSGAQAFDEMDLADLLAAMGRGQRSGQRSPVATDGRDYDTSVQISLEDAHRGKRISLSLTGEGADSVLEVTVPSGVQQGQKLRLRGKGGKGINGGVDGDIYLHIQLQTHPVFRPDHHDLYFDLTLSPWEAALGADVEVPTLDGPVLLTVPPGTRAGRKLRVRGRGLAKSQGAAGDLYAAIRIDVPTTLTDRERELFEELARTSRFQPRELPKESEHGSTAAS